MLLTWRMTGDGALRVSAFFCLVLMLSCTVAFASLDLSWPLQQNYGISATFGESRSDHYHAGIDLSTNGVTGLPVLAVADGSVYRMKIQKRGYGKALYIRHDNGVQSVYAHLEGYSKELGLQTIYTARAARAGTPYVGDIFVEPAIRVKQGQVIAYSGESGAGLPHLHLEIRKSEVIAVNPLSNGLRDIKDANPPMFQACYLYPLTSGSAINGDLDTKELRFKKRQSSFVSDSTPIVRGDFALSVSVYDSTSRPYHRNPHRLSYWLDGKEIYSVEFDQFSYSEPQGFGLLYDLGKPGPSYYEYPILLTRMADFPVPFVKRSIPFSTRSLTPGTHLLKIVASDANNNTSTAEVPFVVNDPPKLEFEFARTEHSELLIGATIQDPNWSGSGALQGEVEYSIDGGKSYQPISITSIVPTSRSNRIVLQYRIPLSSLQKAKFLLVRGRAQDAYESSSYAYSKIRWGAIPEMEQSGALPAGDFRYETYRETIRVIFEPDEPVTEKLQASTGDPPVFFPLEITKPTSLIADIPAPKRTGNFTVSLPGGQSVSIPVQYVKANGSAALTGANFRLSVPENSLYADAWLWSKSLPEYTSKSLPVIGAILQFAPRGLPFRKSPTLSFSYPANFAHPEKLSVYVWDRARQSWRSLPSRVNRSSETVETKIDYIDLFALIYDNVPPRISAIFPKPRSSTRNQTPVLAVHVRDIGMDVDDEKVTLYVDGVPYSAEYDPDRNTATAKVTRALARGNHKFYAVAYDYAGNKTQSATISFRVR